MTPAPVTVDGFRVVCYSPIDYRHRFTGQTKQIVGGVVMGSMSGLAVCEVPGTKAFYLFGCDGEWKVVTDSWHESLEDAKEQAEFEYEGISKTWQHVG